MSLSFTQVSCGREAKLPSQTHQLMQKRNATVFYVHVHVPSCTLYLSNLQHQNTPTEREREREREREEGGRKSSQTTLIGNKANKRGQQKKHDMQMFSFAQNKSWTGTHCTLLT